MTSASYLFSRLLKLIGIQRTQHCLHEAAQEFRILKEAETLLGLDTWRDACQIPELQPITRQIEALQLQKSQLADSTSTTTAQSQLPDQRSLLASKISQIEVENKKITAEAKQLRLQYEEICAQLQLLNDSNGDHHNEREQLSRTSASLKQQFTVIKQQVDNNNANTSSYKEQLGRLANHPAESDSLAEAPRQALLNIERKLETLYAELGADLSYTAHSSSASRKIISKHQSMIRLINALRKSIHLNHHIAGR